MLRTRIAILAAALMAALPLSAQVQLGGHVFVPSNTDSTLGQTSVVITSDANCTLESATNCTVSGGTSGPYTGTLVVTSSVALTATRDVILPLSPGRVYTVENNATGASLLFEGATGGGVTVAVGGVATIYCDGTKYFSTGSGSGTVSPSSTIFLIPEYTGNTTVGPSLLATDPDGDLTIPGTFNNVQIGVTGSSNLNLGGAIRSGISGASNLAIGQNAGSALTSGDSNVLVGPFTDTITSGIGNVLVGLAAGSDLQTGSHNTVVGFDGDSSTGDFSNDVMIGYQTRPTASNQTVIGNFNTNSLLLFGCPTGQIAYDDGSGTCVSVGGSTIVTGSYTCNTSQTLAAPVAPTDTTINLTDASCFPTAGYAAIATNDIGATGGSTLPVNTMEIFSWTGKSGNSLTGVTRALFQTTAASWTNTPPTRNPQYVDGIVSIVAANTTSLPSQITFMDGSAIFNPTTAGYGHTFQHSISFGPEASDPFWAQCDPSNPCYPAWFIGAATYASGTNPLQGPWVTSFSDDLNTNYPTGAMIGNQSNGNQAQTLLNIVNDDITDGGRDSYLTLGMNGTGFSIGSSLDQYGALGLADMAVVGGSGAPLDIFTVEGPNYVDPVIHFQYNNSSTKTADDLTLDSNGFHINDAATAAPEHSNGTCTTALTVAPSNGNNQSVTLTAGDACALTFTQPAQIDSLALTQTVTLKVIQASTPTGTISTSGVYWQGGTVPTITTTAGAIDFLTCYLDGTHVYCSARQNFSVPALSLARRAAARRATARRRRNRRRAVINCSAAALSKK